MGVLVGRGSGLFADVPWKTIAIWSATVLVALVILALLILFVLSGLSANPSVSIFDKMSQEEKQEYFRDRDAQLKLKEEVFQRTLREGRAAVAEALYPNLSSEARDQFINKRADETQKRDKRSME